MFSGNGLLGSAQLFQRVQYDEKIAWIAEDMDFTLSLHEKGAKLFVWSDLIVRHYEREKTKLEQAWIGSEAQAQQKARNWFLFVGKHGKFWDKVAFRCVGLPGCVVWLSCKAVLYGGKESWQIIRGLFRGCREGRTLMNQI
jgi:GT2 family glycosyltransferase